MAIIALTTAAEFAGVHLYIGGISLQMLFNVICIIVSARFQILLQRQGQMPQGAENLSDDHQAPKNHKSAIWLLYSVYSALVLIIFRNIYRAIEYSNGLVSTPTTHEWYTYVFDGTPMLITLVLFNIFNPGRFMQGPRSDFSEENRERKALKQARKMQKRDRKVEMKRLKTERGEGNDTEHWVGDGEVQQARSAPTWRSLTDWRWYGGKLRLARARLH